VARWPAHELKLKWRDSSFLKFCRDSLSQADLGLLVI